MTGGREAAHHTSAFRVQAARNVLRRLLSTLPENDTAFIVAVALNALNRVVNDIPDRHLQIDMDSLPAFVGKFEEMVAQYRREAIFVSVVADAYEACAKAASENNVAEVERLATFADEQKKVWADWRRALELGDV